MRKNEDRKGSGKPFIHAILYGAAAGFLLVLVLFAIFSAIIASGKASENLMPYLTALTAIVSAMLGAVVAVRLHKGQLILIGLSVGALMFIVTFIITLFAGGKFAGSMTTILLVTFLGGGIIGSFLSLKRKRRKHA